MEDFNNCKRVPPLVIYMLSDKEIIQGCIEQKVHAQELLYNRYAPNMYGICLRFAKNAMEADDILQESFIKIFRNLESFQFKGSFEGWIRRTIINTAINYIKKNLKHQYHDDVDEVRTIEGNLESGLEKLSVEELLTLIRELPTGYSTVFNLYVIEGYSHREIAEQLGVSENTSKSQLARARQALQKKLNGLMHNK